MWSTPAETKEHLCRFTSFLGLLSWIVFFFMLQLLMKEVSFPSLPDDQNKVAEHCKPHNTDEEKVLFQEPDTFQFMLSHVRLCYLRIVCV